MRPNAVTPDGLLDGLGTRLEHRAARAARLLRRPSRGLRFPDLAPTRTRLATTVSRAPRPPLQLRLSPQLICGWRLGGPREDTPCRSV
jgi:hypothetical protein